MKAEYGSTFLQRKSEAEANASEMFFYKLTSSVTNSVTN